MPGEGTGRNWRGGWEETSRNNLTGPNRTVFSQSCSYCAIWTEERIIRRTLTMPMLPPYLAKDDTYVLSSYLPVPDVPAPGFGTLMVNPTLSKLKNPFSSMPVCLS